MFLLNSTSVDAGAIIGACHGTNVDACAIMGDDTRLLTRAQSINFTIHIFTIFINNLILFIFS